MKITPPAHLHVVQLCADCFVQTLDGLRIGFADAFLLTRPV
jgi:hypothetical protein